LPKHKLCTATLKDGSPCEHVAVTDDGLCSPCSKRAAKAAAAAELDASGPLEQPDMENAQDFSTEEPVESVPVESLRSELRAGLVTSQTVELIRANLIAGLSAVKEFFVTCPHCHKRHPAAAPDIGVRVSAAEKLLDQLDGKLKAEAATLDQKLAEARSKTQQDIASCSDAELELIVMAASGDGEPPSMKEAARELAEKLLDRRETDPKSFVAKALSPNEAEFIARVSSAGHWQHYPESVFELAEQVLADASASV